MTEILQAMMANPLAQPDSVVERRAAVEAYMAGPLLDGTVEQAATLGGLPTAWIAPAGRGIRPGDGPVVLYLHGGAYEIGSIAAYRPFASQLALLLDAAVAVVEYRLAPEHPFPAAVDDAVDAYADLLAHGHAPQTRALMGDSAGGGLVAAALLAIGRQDLPQPAAGVCLSPWTDLTASADAYERCAATDPFVTRASSLRSAASYLGGADPRDPLASPVHAPAEELGALAPLLIHASAAEVLADDASLLAERVQAAGGVAELGLWPDVTHVWHVLGPAVPEARDALATVARFLEDRWTSG
jgi:epsilon-lactone hydrolase